MFIEDPGSAFESSEAGSKTARSWKSVMIVSSAGSESLEDALDALSELSVMLEDSGNDVLGVRNGVFAPVGVELATSEPPGADSLRMLEASESSDASNAFEAFVTPDTSGAFGMFDVASTFGELVASSKTAELLGMHVAAVLEAVSTLCASSVGGALLGAHVAARFDMAPMMFGVLVATVGAEIVVRPAGHVPTVFVTSPAVLLPPALYFSLSNCASRNLVDLELTGANKPSACSQAAYFAAVDKALMISMRGWNSRDVNSV